MSKSDEKIYLDEKSYQKYLDDIEQLKKRLEEINAGRRDAYDAGSGDGWDTPEFEEIERNERLVLGTLRERLEGLSKIVLLEKTQNNDVIDIGDVVLITLDFGDNDIEDEKVKLVGETPNISASIMEVSVNSPLGKAIYGKNVGDSSSYLANGNQINILIKSKNNLKNNASSNSKSV